MVAASVVRNLPGRLLFRISTWLSTILRSAGMRRLDMLTWMDGNLQPGSKVIADPSVLLPNLLAETKQKYRFELLTRNRAIDRL